MLASALDKAVTFAGGVSFKRKPPTLTKPESTPGDRFDLRKAGQLEELYTLNEREAKVFLFSSLMKQVLNSRQIDDDQRFDRLLHCITSKIVFNATLALNIQDQAVKKQAEQRINSRFIMYVPGIHNLSLENTQWGRRYGNSAESQKLMNSFRKHNCGTTVERNLERPMQGRTTNLPRRRQRHHKDGRAP